MSRSADVLAAAATALEADLGASILEHDQPLGPFTTYRVGGQAALFVEVVDERDLRGFSMVARGKIAATNKRDVERV